jgi:hypothetical protein
VVHDYNFSTSEWRQEDHEFKDKLGYTMRFCFKKANKK